MEKEMFLAKDIDVEMWLGSGILLDKWIRETEKDGQFSAQSPQRIFTKNI